jgi:hypothetical protein
LLELHGYEDPSGGRAYDFTLKTQKGQMDGEDFKALAARLKAFRSRGRLASVYLPLRLFGSSEGVGLSFRQRQLLLAIHRELTRDRKSDRVDRASVIVAGKGATGKGTYAVEHYPGLEEGRRYVGFNGNGGKGRRRLHGRGYRLLSDYGWLTRARFVSLEEEESPWEGVRSFLKDLMQVSAQFGLIAAGRHRTTNEWLALADLLERTRTSSGRKWLAQCLVRIYTEEDYLSRWRRRIAECMGFSVIPDRDQELPVVRSGAGSPAQLLAYLCDAGISQGQLARELGVSRSLLSQYMNGSKSWTKGWQERVATWIEHRETE